MEGPLSKWTNVMKGWQNRWVVLDDHAGLLTYYTSKEKMLRGARRGCVRLKSAIVGIHDEHDTIFTITVDNKTFHFQARNHSEQQEWVRSLEDTIFKHAHRVCKVLNLNRQSSAIRDFDSKVAEADAYLQLLIDQAKTLEQRISSPMTQNDEQSLQCKNILDQANIMLDNLKHSIVLLQIAKNTAHPINGIYLQQSASEAVHPQQQKRAIDCRAVNSRKYASELSVDVRLCSDNSQIIETSSDCLLTVKRHSHSLEHVPVTSYSSSEEEDDFFDANDAPFSGQAHLVPPCSLRSFEVDAPPILPVTTTNSNTNSQQSNASQRASSAPVYSNKQILRTTRQESTVSSKSDNCDYEASLYDDDEENKTLEMESQGSVIRHLLSQVKIGMDLTKVVLPTFILERRSLLEMYADYFAHADIFVHIADYTDPRDRMVQVVRWYLASYHAGRKGAVARKPYNPVLGEMFRCYYDWSDSYGMAEQRAQMNGSTEQNGDCNDFVTNGPIPWCKRNQLAFVAEQVSHHPPISAFYAEHYDKRITFNAHVYTKSKFLGLSVCVYNIGKGVVSVLDYDEEYVLTFPNGYGRSILTVPWIELGGSVTISCQKTGYYANVEFITKPFYGNKKHKITADVFGPDDKRPFVSIAGEWNGVMEAKWTEKTEEFINVNALPIVKKQVKPISEQDENESRRLWKEVTVGLKLNDIERATNAKQTLEQRQREEAKERKESGIEWQTKIFTKGPDDSWLYIHPLRERLSANAT